MLSMLWISSFNGDAILVMISLAADEYSRKIIEDMHTQECWMHHYNPQIVYRVLCPFGPAVIYSGHLTVPRN